MMSYRGTSSQQHDLCTSSNVGPTNYTAFGLFTAYFTNFSDAANAWALPSPPGNTIRSYERFEASLSSVSGSSFTFREAKTSRPSSTEATTTFALARRRTSILITASTSTLQLHTQSLGLLLYNKTRMLFAIRQLLVQWYKIYHTLVHHRLCRTLNCIEHKIYFRSYLEDNKRFTAEENAQLAFLKTNQFCCHYFSQ
ncbi:hypothetical protein Droror1_Dr00026612 [Drosera rotundifolia]